MIKKLALICLATLAFWVSSGRAQEAAGRVLVAVGEVSIVRGPQKIAAQAGAEVRAGDTLQLGTRSNAQVLFTDQSIVALRPDTTFRISEYQFSSREPDKQRAFYELVIGGMRTISGLIGKLNPDSYAVITPNAAFGIRGTNYSLVQCDNSCRNNDGSLAPNGTYGAVTEGRVAVKNKTGELVFGSDQYFRVANQTAGPERLIAPPPFLRDTLEARARAKGAPSAATQQTQQAHGQGQQQAASTATGEAATATAQTVQGAGSGDASVASAVTTATAPAAINTNVFQATTTAASQGLASVVQATSTGTVFYRATGLLNAAAVSCNHPPCGNVTGDITLAVNFALQRASFSANFQTSDGTTINVGTPGNSQGIPVSVSGGQVTLSGTFNLADYPTQQGAFRCNNCGHPSGPSFLDSISLSGTISGATANLTLSGANTGSGGGSFTSVLTQQTPPNTTAAAITIGDLSGGQNSHSAAFWNVSVDASGKLLGVGPTVGAIAASAGTATNTIVGSYPAAGNLAWGKWQGPGANIVDYNYQSYTTPATGQASVQSWITGQIANTLPPSLGTLTYTPVGALVNNGTGVLNSASLSADFVNRSMNISLNATNNAAGNTFQLYGSSGLSPTTGRFSSAFSSVICTGPCGPSPSGGFAGFFAGPNAEGAGVAFNAGFASPGNGVNGVVGMRH